MAVKLPGTPAKRPRARNWKVEPGDEVSTRTDHQVREAILAALHVGPLEKWRIREAIHESETRIARMLGQLRAEKLVQMIRGRRIAQYALIDWEDDVRPKTHPPIVTSAMRKPAPPAESWWIARDRTEFQEQLSRELPRLTRSGGARVHGPTDGNAR